MERELINQPSETLEKILLSVIKWGTGFSLLTSLITANSFFYSFVVPKTLYFRIIIEIIFAAYLILIMSFPKYRPKVNALSVSMFVFVLISIITSIIGVDFSRSFWSVYERETGLFTLLHLYAFFVVLSNVFRSKKDWEKLFFISITAGIICCLTVVAATSSAKGGGTMGNTSFLASYLLFNIFFAIIIIVEKKFSGLGIFAITSLFIFIPILLSSNARGAIISFFGGLALLFIGLLFFSGKKKLRIIAIIAPLVLVLIAGILIFSFPKIQSIITLHLSSMKARYLVWEMAWKGFLERPVLGWGMENFNVVFGKHFNPKLFLGEYGGEVWFDRAHNIILDTLINSGIVGLVSYLSIFCTLIFLLFKKCFMENKEKVSVNLVIISLLLAYFVQNLLVFDMISSYVTFFLTLSFVGYLTQKEDFEENSNLIINSFFKKISYFLIFISTGILIYFGNIQPAYGAINAVRMITSNSVEERIEFYEESLKGFRYDNEINRQFASSLTRSTIDMKESKEILEKALILAEREVLIDVKDNSINLRPYIALARIYISYFRVTLDGYYLNLAEGVLEEAIKLSPENQQLYWFLSDVKFKQGDFDENVKFLEKAIDLEPKLDSSYWYLISSYVMDGYYEEALGVVSRFEKAGLSWRDNKNRSQYIISIYESLKDYETASSLYKKLLVSYPNDADLWLKLAVSLFNIGDKENAKEAAQKAIQINPALSTQLGDILKVLLQ